MLLLTKIQAALGAPRKLQSGAAQADDHSRERYRRALLAGATSALARVVSIASVLISIPVTLNYLGLGRFSVWMTITSLTALLAWFTDFGLGNGLMNAVSRCDARKDYAQLRAYVSTALLILTGTALMLVLLAVFVAPVVPWSTLLAVDSKDVPAQELRQVMTAFIICLAIGIPLAVVQKVQLALQLGYLASLWQLAASAGALLALLVAIAMRASLTWLVVAVVATPSLVYGLSALIFWGRQRPDSRPALLPPKVSDARELMHAGSLFFLIQVAGAAAFASDILLIAHVLDAAAVAQYSVVSKLTDGVVMVSALFLTPLWPAYTEARARGDVAWIKRTLVGSLLGTAAITGVVSLVLLLVSRPVTLAWVGAAVPYSLALFAACGVWAVIKASGNALAMFLNGMGIIGMQAVLAVIFAVVVIAAKIGFMQSFGVIGVPIALALTYVALMVIPFVWRMPRILSTLSS